MSEPKEADILMRGVVVILEDSSERAEAMRCVLGQAAREREVIIFDDAHRMCDWLRANVSSAALISLDHDLEFLEGEDGRRVDPGDGRDVAKVLSQLPPSCPVIVHTSNAPAAQSMGFTLEDAGWQVVRVFPEADCSWIPDRWLPEVQRLLQLR